MTFAAVSLRVNAADAKTDASLTFQMRGKSIGLSAADANRVVGKIEDLVSSANFNSLTHRDPWFKITSEWTNVSDLESRSYLRVNYVSPKEFKTIGGPIRASAVWIEIRDTNPHGGLLPGPLTLMNEGRPVYLAKVSGLLSIGLGLDSALHEFLSPQMRASLESGRNAYTDYLESKKPNSERSAAP